MYSAKYCKQDTCPVRMLDTLSTRYLLSDLATAEDLASMRLTLSDEATCCNCSVDAFVRQIQDALGRTTPLSRLSNSLLHNAPGHAALHRLRTVACISVRRSRWRGSN